MTDRIRPYLYYDVAISICSTCYRKVEGKIVFENGNVFLLKRCPQHGAEKVLVADDIAGAALGSKVLNWFADPYLFLRNWNNPFFLMSGKTVVGGLIGGLFAVEWTNWRTTLTEWLRHCRGA